VELPDGCSTSIVHIDAAETREKNLSRATNRSLSGGELPKSDQAWVMGPSWDLTYDLILSKSILGIMGGEEEAAVFIRDCHK